MYKTSPSLHRTLVYLILGTALILYVLFQARFLILGPMLTIETPNNGATVEESAVISGIARNISKITLNDQQIFINERGSFNETLLLPLGYSVVTISAEDRFGRETVETLELVRVN